MTRQILQVSLAIRGFFVGAGGATAVEYAAVLTLIVGLSYLAYFALAVPSEQSLAHVARSLQGPAESAGGMLSAAQAGRGAASAADSEGVEVAERAAHSASAPWLRWSMLGVTFLAVGAICAEQRWRRRPSAADAATKSEASASSRSRFAEKRQQILRMLTGHAERRPGECVTVRQLMTTKLATTAPSTPVADLTRLMHDGGIRHLLVVRGASELLGVVSDRDLAHRAGRSANDIMTGNPTTVAPETPATQAITAMLQGHFSCVPVVEEGRLVGLLTTSDLIMALQCTLQLLAQSGGDGLLSNVPTEVRGARYFARLVEGAADE